MLENKVSVDNTSERRYSNSNNARKGLDMEVLWGAWVKQVINKIDTNDLSILGIYDSIRKGGKKDFPFCVDLIAIVAYRTFPVEYNQEFMVTLKMLDLDMSTIFSQDELIKVPMMDELIWYENYTLNNVEFREPGTYNLNILINDDRKQYFPLHIYGDRVMILNLEDDSYEERWLEDTDLKKKAGD